MKKTTRKPPVQRLHIILTLGPRGFTPRTTRCIGPACRECQLLQADDATPVVKEDDPHVPPTRN